MNRHSGKSVLRITINQQLVELDPTLRLDDEVAVFYKFGWKEHARLSCSRHIRCSMIGKIVVKGLGEGRYSCLDQ